MRHQGVKSEAPVPTNAISVAAATHQYIHLEFTLHVSQSKR